MKKSITITPHDDEMAEKLRALAVINGFRQKGFETRAAFMEVITHKLPEYCDVKGVAFLQGFWLGRVRDAELINDLEGVLESLKAE